MRQPVTVTLPDDKLPGTDVVELRGLPGRVVTFCRSRGETTAELKLSPELAASLEADGYQVEPVKAKPKPKAKPKA